MLAKVARNDWEGPDGITVNTLNRQNPLPVVDAHCHVFGQSLAEQLEMHEWSNPKMVTFVKAGTNGEVRKLVKPTAFIIKPLPEDLKKFAKDVDSAAKDAKEAKDKAEELEKEVDADPIGGMIKSGLEKEANKYAGELKKDMESHMPGGKLPSEAELKSAMAHAEKAAAASLSVMMRKVNARGVVEVPAKEWPPRVGTTQIGDRIFPVYELSEETTILCPGVGAANTWVGDIKWLITQMENKMAKFIKYFLGDDSANAQTVLDDTPKEGGRAAVPLLLDLGYTPLDIPLPLGNFLLGHLASKMLDLPEPKDDPDGYYTPGKQLIWFDRDKFEYTYDMLSKVAIENAYEMWPMIPFDPRRPDALTHVKKGINELGFVGIKLYSRCGWMPYNNDEIHGMARGRTLDQRLDALYEYVVEEDLPMLNHTSPGGFPPNSLIRLPREYDCCSNLFHNRLLFPGRVGTGPIPVGMESILKKIADFGADQAGLPRPDELKEQAKAIQSSLLNDVAEMGKKTKKLSGERYDDLVGAFEKAKGRGDRGVDELISLAKGSNLSDPNVRKRLTQYIAPEKMDEIAKHLNPSEFFDIATNMKDNDFAKMRDIMDPRNMDETDKAVSEFGKRDPDTEKKSEVQMLFELTCDVFARKSCYDAAKFCHYIQLTVSPYAWEPVLEKHPKLRLNMAHFGSKLALAAYFGLDELYDKQLEEEEKKKKEEEGGDDKDEDKDDSSVSSMVAAGASMLNGSAGGGEDGGGDSGDEDDNDPTNEELFELLGSSTMPELLDHPVVASGSRFKDSLFAKCAQRSGALSTLMREIGTGEDALESEGESDGLLDKVIEKLRPLIFKKVLKEYSIKDLYEGIQKAVPEILDEELWKHWLEDWADTYEKGWVDKIIELMEKYDNVYADLAYFSGYRGEDAEFRPLLKRLTHVACPALKEVEDVEEFTDFDWDAEEHILADRLMIGTDWFMTQMDDMSARDFWNEVKGTMTSEHPLWERWVSKNAVNFMNLEDRIPKLEALYEEKGVPKKKEPTWWAALKAHYKKAAAAAS